MVIYQPFTFSYGHDFTHHFSHSCLDKYIGIPCPQLDRLDGSHDLIPFGHLHETLEIQPLGSMFFLLKTVICSSLAWNWVPDGIASIHFHISFGPHFPVCFSPRWAAETKMLKWCCGTRRSIGVTGSGSGQSGELVQPNYLLLGGAQKQ